MTNDRLQMKSGIVVITLLVGAAFAALASMSNLNDKPLNAGDSNKINFQSASWEESLLEAQKHKKIIFVDLHATWCGPCKMMKLHTFSNKEVASFYNENFVNIALDGETGKGAELMEKYNLRAFPSLLYLNSDGLLITHTKGYHNPKQFMELGRQIQQIK